MFLMCAWRLWRPEEGSASPGTRVGTTGRWRWMWVLGPATDFTCSRLPLQGSGLSACLNLHLPKAHTSSRVGFALAPLLLPLFLHPFHTHFSISSHYPTLSWAHGGGGVLFQLRRNTGSHSATTSTPQKDQGRQHCQAVRPSPAKSHSCTPGESFALPANQCSPRHLST